MSTGHEDESPQPKRHKKSNSDEENKNSNETIFDVSEVKKYLTSALEKINAFRDRVNSLVNEEPDAKISEIDQKDTKENEIIEEKTIEETAVKISPEENTNGVNLDCEGVGLNPVMEPVDKMKDSDDSVVSHGTSNVVVNENNSNNAVVNKVSYTKDNWAEFLLRSSDSDNSICSATNGDDELTKVTSFKPLPKALLLLPTSANIQNVTNLLENAGAKGIEDVVVTKDSFQSNAVVTFSNNENLIYILNLNKQLTFGEHTVLIKKYIEPRDKDVVPCKKLQQLFSPCNKRTGAKNKINSFKNKVEENPQKDKKRSKALRKEAKLAKSKYVPSEMEIVAQLASKERKALRKQKNLEKRRLKKILKNQKLIQQLIGN